MTFVREIARRCSRAGVRVIYVPGCERRGNGQTWARWPEGIVDHHTAGGNNIYVDRILIDGRRDLPGPLCNFATLYDGDLAVVAEHPANHAGASGGWDTWPMPVTRVFNRQTVGNEIQYRGTEPMSRAQWHTILVLNRVTMQVLGEIGAGVLSRNGDPVRIKFHQGTSVTGKWDPGYAPGKTYDIGHFRRAVTNTRPAPAPPPKPAPRRARLTEDHTMHLITAPDETRWVSYFFEPGTLAKITLGWGSPGTLHDAKWWLRKHGWDKGRGVSEIDLAKYAHGGNQPHHMALSWGVLDDADCLEIAVTAPGQGLHIVGTPR